MANGLHTTPVQHWPASYSWLVTARDEAGTAHLSRVPPHPTGGYGLHFVHVLAVAVGWIAAPSSKTVWALMNMTGLA